MLKRYTPLKPGKGLARTGKLAPAKKQTIATRRQVSAA
jgi:hypothetical protein